jgi:hypothetical protein
MSSRRQQPEPPPRMTSNAGIGQKKKLKYWNPSNSNFSEAAYGRDLDNVPTQDNQEMNRKRQELYRNPLFKEVFYPMTRFALDGSPLQYGNLSRTQDSESPSPSLIPCNQVSQSSSNPEETPSSSSLSVDAYGYDIDTQSEIELSYPSIGSVAGEIDDSTRDVGALLASDVQDYLAPVF